LFISEFINDNTRFRPFKEILKYLLSNTIYLIGKLPEKLEVPSPLKMLKELALEP